VNVGSVEEALAGLARAYRVGEIRIAFGSNNTMTKAACELVVNDCDDDSRSAIGCGSTLHDAIRGAIETRLSQLDAEVHAGKVLVEGKIASLAEVRELLAIIDGDGS
jgi:hypothetical protein